MGGVVDYLDVTYGSYSALMSAVIKQPVTVAIQADEPVIQWYMSGVIPKSQCGKSINHAVLLVGYGVWNGVNYWLVKNSWSSRWGMSGYVMLERDGVDGPGTCGIQSYASYPVVKAARCLDAYADVFV